MKKNSYGTILWIISRYLNGIYAKCHTILEQLFTVSKPFLKSWLLKSTLFKWIHMKKAAIGRGNQRFEIGDGWIVTDHFLLSEIIRSVINILPFLKMFIVFSNYWEKSVIVSAFLFWILTGIFLNGCIWEKTQTDKRLSGNNNFRNFYFGNSIYISVTKRFFTKYK